MGRFQKLTSIYLLRCLVSSTDRVISAFTTHLFLGTTIDYEIMATISLPIPGALPMYPYIPAWLFPAFYRYTCASLHAAYNQPQFVL